jgi:hypothetical protein
VSDKRSRSSPFFLLRAIHCADAHMFETQRTDEFLSTAGTLFSYRCSKFPFAKDTCLSGNLPQLGVSRCYEPQETYD